MLASRHATPSQILGSAPNFRWIHPLRIHLAAISPRRSGGIRPPPSGRSGGGLGVTPRRGRNAPGQVVEAVGGQRADGGGGPPVGWVVNGLAPAVSRGCSANP